MPYRREKERRITVRWRYGNDRIICKACRHRIPYETACIEFLYVGPDPAITHICEHCLWKHLKGLHLSRDRHTYR